MKESPILYSTEMGIAALEDRKTQTRRVMKPQPTCHCDKPDWRGQRIDWVGYKYEGRDGWFCYTCGNGLKHIDEFSAHGIICPYGQPGDRLWVRERALYWTGGAGGTSNIAYFDDPEIPQLLEDNNRLLMPRETTNILAGENVIGKWKWKSARFMFKKDARLWLEITGVRVERLQEITEADAIAEGVETMRRPDGTMQYLEIYKGMPYWGTNARDAFHTAIWDPINAKRGYGWDTDPRVWVIEGRRLPAQDVTSEK